MKNMAAAARSSSLAPSSSAHGSDRIGMGAVEIGSGAGGGAAGGGGGGGGGAGGGTGAQAASRRTDSEMRGGRILASPLLWVGLFFAALLLHMQALRPVLQWAFPGTEPVMGPVPAVGQHTSAIMAELGLVDVEAK